MIAYCSLRAGRAVALTVAAVLGLGALTACGGGSVSTVTVTATVTVSASASAPATSPAGTRPAGSTASGSPASEAPTPPSGSAVPTSSAQETIMTVRLQAYDPATGTLTFIPQDVVGTEGDASAVLSDPVGATQVTAQVTAQTNVKFLRYGADIGAAITANDVYCTMVLDGSQVSYLWELYAT